jgi:hypothetical protein
VGKSLVLEVVIMHGTTVCPEFAQYSNSSLERLGAITNCLFIHIDVRR